MEFGGSGVTLDSVTIGGISATVHVVLNNGDDIICAIASATVPTGTTAVVVATFSDDVDDPFIGCIALDNLQGGGTVTDTMTGEVASYHNPPGEICGGADTQAF